jgi:hypothetical protein
MLSIGVNALEANMFHFLVTNDWHLEGLAKHFPHDHIERQLAEIDKIYQYALSRGIQHIMVPGDITDKHYMSDDTKRKFMQFFRKYDGVIDTWYIGGNHDRADTHRTSVDLISDFCEWDFLKSLHVFLEPKQVEIEGIVCNMLPHPSKKSIKSKKPCLNFVHANVVGAVGDNGRAIRVSHDIVVNERDFTFDGHIHQHQFLESRRTLLAGAPYQKNFGESAAKGFVEAKARYKKGELVVDWQFIDSKPDFLFETVVINDASQFAELLAYPSRRYRLYIKEGVVVPADIKVRLPNISQLHHVKGSVAAALEKKLVLGTVSIDAVDPREGLKDFMTAFGLDKKQRKIGRSMLEAALSEIGSV